VIIGATAFPVHGYVRATIDIDIFIEPTLENANRTIQALEEFGYDLTDTNSDDFLKNKILIRQYLVETDIHPFVNAISFKEVWSTKVKSKIGRTPAYFAGLDALIKMKKAAGRENKKDFVDLYFILQRFNLIGLLQKHEQKYGPDWSNRYHLLKSLIYFTDAEADPMPELLQPVSWLTVKETISRAVQRIDPF
jgi:hypothetical protein